VQEGAVGWLLVGTAWIDNDPEISLTKQDGDALINDSNDLAVLADLANGSKHLTLNRPPRSGNPATRISRNDVTVDLSDGGNVRHRFYIASGCKSYDALKLAKDAVQERADFLRKHGTL
jgi:hypothetical protein